MTLSCSCDNDPEWYYYSPDDFSIFNEIRRKRCVSCGILVNFGTDCLEFSRYRNTHSDIEERIWGTEIPMANKYMCKKCGEIFLNLDSIGYRIALGENMQDLIEDYWDITGFKTAAEL